MAILRFDPIGAWSRFPRVPALFDEDEWPDAPVNQGLDVYETDNEVIVKAAVPGVPSDKVEVTFEDGVLRIKARVEETKEEKEKKKVVYRQQRVASFDYTTTLPRAVNGETITADVNDGVVTVKAPIAQEAKPRRITVKAKTK